MSRPLERRLGALAVATVLALGLAACGGGSTTNPTGGNPGGGGTSTAPAPFNFTFPQAGRSVTLVFPNAGTFAYYCQAHRSDGMAGVVVVGAGGLDSTVVSVGGSNSRSFNPASVTIRPGGYVRWVNASSRNDHTVTSD